MTACVASIIAEVAPVVAANLPRMNQPPPPAGSWAPPPPPPPVPAAGSREPYFTPAGGEPQQLSGYGARVGAFFLDLLVVFGLQFALGFVIGIVVAASGGKVSDDRDLFQALSIALGLLVTLCYLTILESRKGAHNGQTLGKQATGIRIVRDDGQPMTFGRALLREGVGKQLLGIITLYIYLIVDYLWPLWDRENQALHDKIASTHVVALRPSTAIGPAPSAAAPIAWPASTVPAAPPWGTAAPPPAPAAPRPAAVPPPPPPPPSDQTFGGFAPPSAAPPPPDPPAAPDN
jgi:uncharacterized RDD family membrane protein YckC